MKTQANGFVLQQNAGRETVQKSAPLSKHLQDHRETNWLYRMKTNKALEDSATFPTGQATWPEKAFQREKQGSDKNREKQVFVKSQRNMLKWWGFHCVKYHFSSPGC